MKKKWFRRTLLLLATVMVVLLGGVMVALWLVRAQPSFYRPSTLTVQERAQAAQSAEEKFIQIQNRAAQISAAASATHRGTNAPIVLNGEPVTISFTDTELNAFFDKWSNFQDWKSKYEPYLNDPAIVLQDGRLIIAAQLKEPALVVSLHFEPMIDENGQLRLELARILGGRLPLPEAMISKYRTKLTASLQERLPAWQRAAKIDAGGAANNGAIAASASKLLVNVLNHEPAEPVIFLPVFGQSGSVPVKIQKVKIDDGSLTVTVVPLSKPEQTALLERIRSVETTSAR